MFRDQFFAHSSTLEIVPVKTPAGDAFVRALSVGEKDTFDRAVAKDKNVSFRARLVVMTTCDEAGNLVFEPGDVYRIADYPVTLVEPLVDAAIAVNKLSAEDVETLEKNSRSQSGSSSIG